MTEPVHPVKKPDQTDRENHEDGSKKKCQEAYLLLMS
jgi:hypothetical protein